MGSQMPQGLVDMTALGRILGVAQRLLSSAEVDAHDCGFDARLLHDVEGFPGIDRAKLLPVADAGEAVQFQQISQTNELLLVGIADH